MPISRLKASAYRPPKENVVTWNTWRKGLNLLLRENELDGSEMCLATNIMLVGSGIPTKRWGSNNYFAAAPSGSGQVRFVLPVKDETDKQEVLALTDWGYIVRKNGASYQMVAGASWASGSDMAGTQLGGNAYLVSSNRPMVKYDFNTLTSFATLATVTGVAVARVSLPTGNLVGTNTVSWRVTATSKSGGETIASTPVSLSSLPQSLASTPVTVTWSAVSAGAGDLLGYNIYRGPSGQESWVGGVDDVVTSWIDYGTNQGDPFRTAPLANSTGGPKGKYIIRYQDRMIIAGVPGEPTKVLISGRYPNHERFDWYAGGGYVLIEPDSGEDITGLGIHQEKLVVFKEKSVWQVALNQIQYGNYLILDPQYHLLTASQGCSSHKSIVPVENDLMFANRKGIYILRYEPQLLTILNANEISAKIRPFFEGLTDTDLTNAAGAYIDKKYVLSFPHSKKTIVFDRERLSFSGPWNTPFGINHWAQFVDDTGRDRWVAADSTDVEVTEFSSTSPDDKGSPIRTIFKSKKEDFGDWTVFKTINEVFMNFRSIAGAININLYLEDRAGKTITAKSFSITATGTAGTSGIGTDFFGIPFGETMNDAKLMEDEITRKAFIYKTSRTFQIEIRTDKSTDDFELLGIKAVAVPQARGNSPSAWNVS